MQSKLKILVCSTTNREPNYHVSERLNAAIDELAEFIRHNTPIHPGSLAAIEFLAAINEARS